MFLPKIQATAVLLLVESLSSCATRRPESVAHPVAGGRMPVLVAYAPPPAQVEQVPPSPAESCMWNSGYWVWLQGGWQWHVGEWVHVGPNCGRADSLTFWVSEGETARLYHRAAAWYRGGGQLCAVTACAGSQKAEKRP